MVPVRTWTIGEEGEDLGLLVHAGEKKDVEARVPRNEIVRIFDAKQNRKLKVWLVSGSREIYYSEPDLSALPVGDLPRARAHWVSRSVIAWRTDTTDASFSLHFSGTASLSADSAGMHNGGEPGGVQLQADPQGLPPEALERFPFLSGAACLRVPPGVDAAALVCGQLAVLKASGEGALDCTGVQAHGLLDELFAYDGPLGCALGVSEVAVAVWAPTSQEVELLLFEGPRGGEPVAHAMERGDDGVWRASGPPSWAGLYYQYRLRNYSPATGRVETVTTPDPYSRAVSANGQRSQIVDINAAEFVPPGWEQLSAEKPPLEHHADAAIYELHIRDFSALDKTVPPDLRGKYLAFEEDTSGTRHLAGLAAAGLTHVHLLPCYDFGSVPELASDRKEPDLERLSSLPSASEQQQRIVGEVADADSFNWGYDPVLYGVPEGSYATDAAVDGAARSLEFRRMVAALNRLGLRVVVDVVYNHVLSSGPHSDLSVYDKIVPGYYLRRSEDGSIENSTCCNNTASENRMVERLIVDDIMHWATSYKVDGFRFDLMGHMMLRTMTRAREALDSLTVEENGVDGSKVLMYGEGWDFGEVAGCARGVNGSQLNLGGSGIGSFNDRIREPTVGGSPFADPRLQGFATGLLLSPWPEAASGVDQGSEEQQREGLLHACDKIRLGLAGNIASYTLEDFRGNFVRGDVAHGGGIAYAKEPQETINYVSAHDNETLFDMCVLKMPPDLRTTAERVRASWLCTSVVALGNGIPFFHAGDELLRSKSLDRDSYNSGDWFNRLDFTGGTHNLGVGLPPAAKNRGRWALMEPLLADPSLRPSREQILASTEKLKELLGIRRSTALLGLRESKEIMRRVRFPNSGPKQIPGLIVMEVVDKGWSGEHSDPASRFAPLQQLCDSFCRVVVAFNARTSPVGFEVEGSGQLQLHHLQAGSCDDALKDVEIDGDQLKVPALTAAVFVENR